MFDRTFNGAYAAYIRGFAEQEIDNKYNHLSDFRQEVKQSLRFHYGSVLREGVSFKKEKKRVYQLLKSSCAALIKAIDSFFHALFSLCDLSQTQAQAQVSFFSAARYFQDSISWLYLSLNEEAASFSLQDSRFQRFCYSRHQEKAPSDIPSFLKLSDQLLIECWLYEHGFESFAALKNSWQGFSGEDQNYFLALFNPIPRKKVKNELSPLPAAAPVCPPIVDPAKTVFKSNQSDMGDLNQNVSDLEGDEVWKDTLKRLNIEQLKIALKNETEIVENIIFQKEHASSAFTEQALEVMHQSKVDHQERAKEIKRALKEKGVNLSSLGDKDETEVSAVSAVPVLTRQAEPRITWKLPPKFVDLYS